MECSYHYKNGNLQFVSSIDVFGNQPERFGTVLRGAVAVLEGYKYDKAHDIYICNYCAQKFLLIQNNNTLTQNQKDLILPFASGISDKEMASKLGVTEATIRRHRFTFREQAKYYLAIYKQSLGLKEVSENAIMPIHNHASYVGNLAKPTEPSQG